MGVYRSGGKKKTWKKVKKIVKKSGGKKVEQKKIKKVGKKVGVKYLLIIL